MITLEQLVSVMLESLAWMRVYPGGQRREHEDFMGSESIRAGMAKYGGKPVWKAQPGYCFMIVHIDD